MQQRLLFILSFILITGTSSLAQDAILKGKVISAQSQAPLEYAVVQISDSGDSIYSQVITDQKGRYECSGISFGKYIISFQYLGFETWQKDLEVTTGKIKLDDILLMPKEYLLQEAAVSGEARPSEYRVDKQVINVAKQLESTFRKCQPSSLAYPISLIILNLQRCVMVSAQILIRGWTINNIF